MGIEIERKYLVNRKEFDKIKDKLTVRYITQGYISREENAIVRARTYGNKGYITIKGKTKSMSRLEYEYEIPCEDVKEILSKMSSGYIIKKNRYNYIFNEKLWIIDEFFGENSGLLLAEIELKSEDEFFTKPNFVGEEVTNDFRYANSNLAQNPYCENK